jgi:hypothetical protein
MRTREAGRRLLPWAVIVGLAAAAFAPCLGQGFVYDDALVIVHNPPVSEPGSWLRFWSAPFWPPGTTYVRLFRPLTILLFRAEVVLAGGVPRPIVFHAVSLLLHALASLGVAALAARISGRREAGWLAGAVHATHPLHTEAVAAAYGQSELLVGTLGAWLLALHARPPEVGAAPMALRWALLLGAVASKEHGILLWPVLLLFDAWWVLRRAKGASFRPALVPLHLGYALVCVAYLARRIQVLGVFAQVDTTMVRLLDSPMSHASTLEHVLTPFRLLWLTLVLLLRPGRLCPIWSYPALAPASRLSADVLGGMALAAALVTLAVVLWRRGSPAAVLVPGLLVLLAIPIQVLPKGNWIYAERWLYLPSVIMAALVGSAAAAHGRRVAIAAGAVALALVVPSRTYTRAFADDLTMSREIVRRQPDNFQGHRNLAIALYNAGLHPEAIAEAEEVIRRFGVSDPYYVLLVAHLAMGHGRPALDALEALLRARPDIPPAALDRERRQAEALIASATPPRR